MNKKAFLRILLLCTFIPLHLAATSLSQFQDRYEQIGQEATTVEERVKALLEILKSISTHEDVWFEDFDTLYNTIDREVKDLLDTDDTLEKYEDRRLSIAQQAETNGITVTLKQTTSLLKRIKRYFTKNRKKIIIGGLTAVGIAATYVYFSRKIAAENAAALKEYHDEYLTLLDAFEDTFGEQFIEQIKAQDDEYEFYEARRDALKQLNELESSARNLKITLRSKSHAKELRAKVKALHHRMTALRYQFRDLLYTSPTAGKSDPEKIAYYLPIISKEREELSDFVSAKRKILKDLDPSDPSFGELFDEVTSKISAAERSLKSKYQKLIDYEQYWDTVSHENKYRPSKPQHQRWGYPREEAEFSTPRREILNALNEFDTTIKNLEAKQKAFKLPVEIERKHANFKRASESHIASKQSGTLETIIYIANQNLSRFEKSIAQMEDAEAATAAINRFKETVTDAEKQFAPIKVQGIHNEVRNLARDLEPEVAQDIQQLLTQETKGMFDSQLKRVRDKHEHKKAQIKEHKTTSARYAEQTDTTALDKVIEKLEEKLKAHATELDDIEQNWSERTLPMRVKNAHETFTRSTSDSLRALDNEPRFRQRSRLKSLVRTTQNAQKKAAEFKKETEQLGDQTPAEAAAELKRYEESIKNIDVQVIELERNINVHENKRNYNEFERNANTFLNRAETEDLAELSDADFQTKYTDYEKQIDQFKRDADRHRKLVPEYSTQIEQLEGRFTTLKDGMKTRYVLAKKKDIINRFTEHMKKAKASIAKANSALNTLPNKKYSEFEAESEKVLTRVRNDLAAGRQISRDVGALHNEWESVHISKQADAQEDTARRAIELERKIAETQDGLRILGEQIETLVVQLDSKEITEAQFQEQYDPLKDRKQNLQTHLSEQMTALEHVESRGAQTEATPEEINREVASVRSTLIKQQDALQGMIAQRKAEALEEQKAELQQKIHEFLAGEYSIESLERMTHQNFFATEDKAKRKLKKLVDAFTKLKEDPAAWKHRSDLDQLEQQHKAYQHKFENVKKQQEATRLAGEVELQVKLADLLIADNTAAKLADLSIQNLLTHAELNKKKIEERISSLKDAQSSVAPGSGQRQRLQSKQSELKELTATLEKTIRDRQQELVASFEANVDNHILKARYVETLRQSLGSVEEQRQKKQQEMAHTLSYLKLEIATVNSKLKDFNGSPEERRELESQLETLVEHFFDKRKPLQLLETKLGVYQAAYEHAYLQLKNRLQLDRIPVAEITQPYKLSQLKTAMIYFKNTFDIVNKKGTTQTPLMYPYAALGLSPSAQSSAIKRAYVTLSRSQHPDKFTDPAEKLIAEERYRHITDAYSILKDKDKKAFFDAFGATVSPNYEKITIEMAPKLKNPAALPTDPVY